MKYKYTYEIEFGCYTFYQEDNFLVGFNSYMKEEDEYKVEETDLIKKAYSQIKEYFDGERKNFDLPLNPKGTEFQRKVWIELLKIPYGSTSSYKDIAQAVDSPKAFRAVGNANNKNPISIIIPCHRVIGSSGSLVGYYHGLDMKEKLLKLETDNKY